METSQYRELFISESREILAKLNKLLVELEKNPENPELLNEIFRLAHTLKGMAGSMGYETIVKLSHSMESVLDLLRNHRLRAEKDTVSLLFESFDLLEGLIEEIATEESPERSRGTGAETGKGARAEKKKADITCVVDKLGEIACKVAPVKEEVFKEKRMLRLDDEDRMAIAKAATDGALTYRAAVTLDKKCKMREVRAFLVLKELKGMGEVIKEHYILNQIKSARFGRYFGLFFMTKEKPELVKEKIEAISEIERITFKLLEVDEALITKKPVTSNQKPEKTEIKKLPEAQTVRVAVERLDNLMNLVGELAINKIRLLNIGAPLENKPLIEALTQLNRLSSDLQTEMMTVRLVPMAYIFDRFPRMVRDLAKEESKEIDLEIEGSDIGLDRTILDEINDPLIHLLRNSVSHGIEEPKERLKVDKPKTGKIKLAARKERNFVLIEVSDDGKGMDVNEVKKIAVEKKIIDKEEASKLNDQDAMMLITTAGFSTSKKVTQTSGRGVGMNTVRAKVESFGGSLSIETGPDKGSKFTLKLPVSMAILQALLVKVANETYAIPLTNISETIKIGTDTIKTMEHHEVVPYRDEVLPLIRLREKFGFSTETRNQKPETRLPVVVVEVGYRKAGFIVDQLVGEQEVVIKSLTGDLKGMRGVAGATIMGDGRVALIVDAPSII